MSQDQKDQLLFDSYEGILLGTLDDWESDQPGKVYELCDGVARLAVVIPNEHVAHNLLSRPLMTHRFQIVDRKSAGNGADVLPAVVIDAWSVDMHYALQELPPDQCPIANVLPLTLARIESLVTTPLRAMVKRIFMDREVCKTYWTMPASARHHHAYPGGLAKHSLEVADDLAGQTHLSEVESDLGVAGALLHDIGKVWAYQDNMHLSPAGLAMGHELLGLARLEKELSLLESDWPDGAYALRVLISGCARMRQDGSLPMALLARIKAADQRSCELDKTSRRGGRSWIPQPWPVEKPPQPEI